MDQGDCMKKRLVEIDKWCQEKCDEMGVTYFPINWEVVPEDVMLEVMSYGLPTRARHWTYGQSYKYQKLNGEMGMSKVYELILNNNPSYAFLLDTNPDIAQIMVIAHCYGHSAFFKNNHLFKETDRKMVYRAAERAERIDSYILKYGLERVEHIMDIGLSVEKNIDWHKGIFREKYSSVKKIRADREKGEFEDLLKNPTSEKPNKKVSFPPSKEFDINWFLINYSNKLEDWEKDVLSIIREEAFYFYPQYVTKIMNEGFASYMHAELMYIMGEELLSPSEYLDFVKIHERVVQPGGDPFNLNPYFLGFTIFNNIKKKWDELHKTGESKITGFQKILEVVEEEDDISFLKTYLTQDIVDELKMFTYTKVQSPNGEYINIKSNRAEDIVNAKISKMYNYMSPLIAITNVTQDSLELEHVNPEIGTIYYKDLPKVMGYIYEAWGNVVDLQTLDAEGKIYHFTFDEGGFSDSEPKDEKKLIRKIKRP
jgi:stage V sporulation protein R